MTVVMYPDIVECMKKEVNAKIDDDVKRLWAEVAERLVAIQRAEETRAGCLAQIDAKYHDGQSEKTDE